MRVESGPRVRVVSVVLLDEVDRQRDDGDRRVVRHRRQAAREQCAGVRAGAPHIQRVARLETGVQQRPDALLGGGGQGGERHPHPVREVGHQHALGTRVVHRRDAGAGPDPSHPSTGGEDLEQVGHLVEVGHPQQAVRLGQRLPGGVTAGEGAGVRGYHRGGHRCAADREQDDRHVLGGRSRQRPPQPHRLVQGLEHERDDPRLGPVERVLDVVGGAGDDLLPRRHRQRVADPSPAPQHGREHRARVGDQAHRAGRQLGPLQVADRPQPAGHVDEAHAAAAAQCHARTPGDRRQPVTQRRPGPRCRPRRAEDDRRPVAPSGGPLQLVLESVVTDGEQHEVDRVGHVVQGAHARQALHLVIPWVDEVQPWPGAAAAQLGDQALAEAAATPAGPDHRHRARAEHGADRVARPHACSSSRRPQHRLLGPD